jgi:hypothetical protein
LDVVVLLLSCFLPYPHHPHLPLIIALLLNLIMVILFTFMFILIKPLCGWSGIVWGLTLQLFTWILRPYITNSVSTKDHTLLHLKFFNSSYIATTQSGSRSAFSTLKGSKEETNE